MTAFDIVMLAILLLCLLVGLRRGFVLTLCGLLAVIIALAGAQIATNYYAPAVTEAIAPRIETVISDQLDKSVDETLNNLGGEDDSEGELPGILGILQRSGLEIGALTEVQSAVHSGLQDTVDSAARNMAVSVASSVARTAVYSISFAVILLLWHLISAVLNLVARLPVLRSFNRLLGGVCGLVKGFVITGIISCLILFLGLLPADLCHQSVFLRIFSVITGSAI